MKLSPEDKVVKARIAYMEHKETMQYAGLTMIGNVIMSDAVPTAGTNGRDVMFNPEFVEGLTQQQVVGLIMHEDGHKLYQHGSAWERIRKEDPMLYNCAADYVINIEINDLAQKYSNFIAMPAEDALVDEKYRGWSTAEVYADLKKNGNKKHGIPKGGFPKIEVHVVCGHQGDPSQGDGPKGQFDSHNFGALTDEQAKKLTEEVDNAIRQGALMAGKLGGNADKMGEMKEVKVDWREPLEQFMTDVSKGTDYMTWARPDRRWQASGTFMPSSISESMGVLGLVIDTSGSIFCTPELVSEFLAHMRAMFYAVNPTALHVVECDSEVTAHEVYDESNVHELDAKLKVHGGGGTDMCVALDYFKDKNINPEAIVVLTDGYTPFPTELTCPTLWAITESHIHAPIGVTIHVEV